MGRINKTYLAILLSPAVAMVFLWIVWSMGQFPRFAVETMVAFANLIK